MTQDKKITWVNSEEVNNNYFSVFRSSDLKGWNELAQIKSKGDNPLSTNYNFLDQLPSKGLNYYKIGQSDFDGIKTFTKIIAIVVDHNQELKIFPNPSSDIVTLPEKLVILRF